MKYNISQVAVKGKKDKNGNGTWVLRLGFDPPSAEVPLFVTKIITNLSSPEVNKIKLGDDTDLEEGMQSGLCNKITDIEAEGKITKMLKKYSSSFFRSGIFRGLFSLFCF